MASTHGTAQLQAHAAAAEKYSIALASKDADLIEEAKVVLDATYIAYTNPHRVPRTVDVRWPAVGASEEVLRMMEN